MVTQDVAQKQHSQRTGPTSLYCSNCAPKPFPQSLTVLEQSSHTHLQQPLAANIPGSKSSHTAIRASSPTSQVSPTGTRATTTPGFCNHKHKATQTQHLFPTNTPPIGTSLYLSFQVCLVKGGGTLSYLVACSTGIDLAISPPYVFLHQEGVVLARLLSFFRL